MGTQLPISTVVDVSVSQAPAGIGEFNVNNLLLLTDDVPNPAPTGGFGRFLTPEAVATVYGSSSRTAKMANLVFGQSPNILAGGGELIVAPLLLDLAGVTAVQKWTFSALPASGTYVLNYGIHASAAINWDDDAAAIQTKLRAVSGLGSVTVAGSAAAGFSVTFTGVDGPVALLTASAVSLEDSGSAAVTLTIVTTTPGRADGSTETMIDGIQRLQALVSFCGVMKTDTWVTNEIMDAAVYVETQNMIMGVQSDSAADVAATTGILWQIAQASLGQTRGFLYTRDDYEAACEMMAAYMGRAFSTAFDGSNTTQNMQLKTLIGILADDQMTLDLYTLAKAAGADVYPSVQGVPKVLSSGVNRFFDQVYNQMWFVTQIEVGVFNALATTSTKIPQTEQGMGVLKNACQRVCEQAKVNLYCAPGSWSGGTFGPQQDFLRNIADVGYFIFSAPITQQSQSDRDNRIAPLIQIALKEAGAINSAQILININA